MQLARRSRLLLLVSVLVALGSAQTLGLLHRIVHAPQLRVAAAVPASTTVTSVGSVAVQAAAVVGSTTGAWLKALFDGHDSEKGCELYDQLAHVDLAATVPDPTLPGPDAEADATPHAGWHLASQAAGFLARGPPPAA